MLDVRAGCVGSGRGRGWREEKALRRAIALFGNGIDGPQRTFLRLPYSVFFGFLKFSIVRRLVLNTAHTPR